MPALSPPTADRPRRVTITQVAEASGVARATAAFVISGRAPELRISPKTIERVQAVADLVERRRHRCPTLEKDDQ